MEIEINNKGCKDLCNIIFEEEIKNYLCMGIKYTNILQLRWKEDKSFKQIASIYKIPEKEIRIIYNEALKDFRYKLRIALSAFKNHTNNAEEIVELRKQIKSLERKNKRAKGYKKKEKVISNKINLNIVERSSNGLLSSVRNK